MEICQHLFYLADAFAILAEWNKVGRSQRVRKYFLLLVDMLCNLIGVGANPAYKFDGGIEQGNHLRIVMAYIRLLVVSECGAAHQSTQITVGVSVGS